MPGTGSTATIEVPGLEMRYNLLACILPEYGGVEGPLNILNHVVSDIENVVTRTYEM